jgi:putative endonuclease
MHHDERKKQSRSKCHGIGEHRLSIGREGEEKAAAHLEQLGWRIKARNWRSGRYAEVDIIAVDPTGCLVFVEVKTRVINSDIAGAGFVSAGFEKVDWRKRIKLINAARVYLAERPQYQQACRFDAAVVYITSHSCGTPTGSRADGVVIKECLLDAEIQVVHDIH